MIRIICDRCGKEINDGNVGYIATNWRSMENGCLLGDNPHEEKHFCKSCMEQIEEFVIKSPESVIKIVENVSETLESVPKEDESVSVYEEPALEPETSMGKRKPIDVGKIMALKNAGWKNKDIADEMHMDPQTVANVIYQQRKKAQSQGTVTMKRLGEISNERHKL